MKIFALCGSLRAQSYNLAILNSAQRQAPPFVTLEIFDQLERIPPFHPEIKEEDGRLAPVIQLRKQICEADVIFIASPEYVHGVPGVLKNALDWTVGSGEWDKKPCAIVNVTSSANEPKFVRDGLFEILGVMTGGCVLEKASFMVTGAFKKFHADGTIIDPKLSENLDSALRIMIEAAESRAPGTKG